jgi:hypothetical protein
MERRPARARTRVFELPSASVLVAGLGLLLALILVVLIVPR